MFIFGKYTYFNDNNLNQHLTNNIAEAYNSKLNKNFNKKPNLK